MTKIKVTIPFGNGPNRNGRCYSPEVVKQMVDNIIQNKFPVTNPVTEITSSVEEKDIIGWTKEADYNEDGNRIELTCDINSEDVITLLESGFKIVPNGIGDIDSETKQVKDYSLVQFSITNDSAFVTDIDFDGESE